MNPYAIVKNDLAEEINSDQEAIDREEQALLLKKSALDEKRKLFDFAKKRYEKAESIATPIKAKASIPRTINIKLGPLPQVAESASKRQGRVINAVLSAIDALGAAGFSPRDVEAEMERQGTALTGVQPRARISTFLKDLASEGELMMVHEGKGGIPNTYRKKSLMTETEIHAIKNPAALGVLGF